MFCFEPRTVGGSTLNKEEKKNIKYLVNNIEVELNNLYSFTGKFSFYIRGCLGYHNKNEIRYVLVSCPIILFYKDYEIEEDYCSMNMKEPLTSPIDLDTLSKYAQTIPAYYLYRPLVFSSKDYLKVLEVANMYKSCAGLCRLETINKIILDNVSRYGTLSITKGKYDFIKDEIKFYKDGEKELKEKLNLLVVHRWSPSTMYGYAEGEKHIHINVSERDPNEIIAVVPLSKASDADSDLKV